MSIVHKDAMSGGEPLSPWTRVARKEATPGLVQALRVLVADGYALYLRAHGYHWNVKGQDFAQYHELFAEIYSDVHEAIDQTAESLLKLGFDAPFRMPELLSLRTIQDQPIMVNDPQVLAADLLGGNEAMLASLKAALREATAADEQGISNFLSERIDVHQRWSWQLRASTGQQ